MTTTTMFGICLKREITNSTSLTNDLFAATYRSAQATKNWTRRYRTEKPGAGTTAYFLECAGTLRTDVEPILGPSR
jgi:hypothetical protein